MAVGPYAEVLPRSRVQQVARPPGATAGAELERPLKMPEFHAEPGQRCERVDDEPAVVAGVVVVLVGTRRRLGSAVDTDRGFR